MSPIDSRGPVRPDLRKYIAVLFRHIPDHGEHANGPTLIVYGVPAVEASHVDPIEKTNDECHP